MQSRQRALLVLAAGAFVGCAGLGRDSSAAVADIAVANAALDSAYRAGDAPGAARLFTEDATLMPPGARNLEGRQTIRSFLDLYFRRTSVLQYTLAIGELDVYGDVAYEFGTYQWSNVVPEGDTISEVGRYAAVRRKGEDGVWRIHRLLDNSAPRTMH